eukprot:scaffold89378_cov20-Tisochrysis_lutea.AAC.3
MSRRQSWPTCFQQDLGDNRSISCTRFSPVLGATFAMLCDASAWQSTIPGFGGGPPRQGWAQPEWKAEPQWELLVLFFTFIASEALFAAMGCKQGSCAARRERSQGKLNTCVRNCPMQHFVSSISGGLAHSEGKQRVQ